MCLKEKGWQTFSIKGQLKTVLGFKSYPVFLKLLLLYHGQNKQLQQQDLVNELLFLSPCIKA